MKKKNNQALTLLFKFLILHEFIILGLGAVPGVDCQLVNSGLCSSCSISNTYYYCQSCADVNLKLLWFVSNDICTFKDCLICISPTNFDNTLYSNTPNSYGVLRNIYLETNGNYYFCSSPCIKCTEKTYCTTCPSTYYLFASSSGSGKYDQCKSTAESINGLYYIVSGTDNGSGVVDLCTNDPTKCSCPVNKLKITGTQTCVDLGCLTIACTENTVSSVMRGFYTDSAVSVINEGKATAYYCVSPCITCTSTGCISCKPKLTNFQR